MKKRIFISSTIFDLIDIRAETYVLLQEMGFSAIMSDVNESSFHVPDFQNSIEACLQNVRNSDIFILILSNRYGSSLMQAGFEDVSATHLEYKEALANKKPILFYVRDRLEADFRIWKKNDKSDSLNLSWVNKNNQRIFEIIEKHGKLNASKDVSNWISTFKDSLELKELIKRDLGNISKTENFQRQIREARVPVLYASVDCEFIKGSPVGILSVKCTIENAGNVPSYNVVCYWVGNAEAQSELSKRAIPIIPPGKSTTASFIYTIHPDKREVEDLLRVTYETGEGNKIFDEFEIGASLHNVNGHEMTYSYGNLISKRYFVSQDKIVTIEEDPLKA
ncbi:MAG: hypothetical protein CVT92_13265 [Bacteroidetes bacterium HGW-Bacteroidetes-1]|jgi:hypothetical protein|nr:MAG: hypothetical protein CVT92_13265 [Bacteroidetes bacterium HGW-Bacteroidetes-1]